MKLMLNSVKLNRSLVDGPGVRTVIFLQGCNLHCKGCHNKSTWDITKGTEVDIKEFADFLRKEVVNKKITISGGEPLMQKESILELINLIPDFDIALYTGHELEDVPKEILNKLTYLKTGPFVEELKTTIMPYVGSSNQKFRRLE